MQRPHLLLPLAVAAVLLCCVASRPQPVPNALVLLRDALDPFTVQQLRWTATSDACGATDCDESSCNWRGVSCVDANVVGINLTGTAIPPGRITGRIDESLFYLPFLRYLVVPDQRLSGPLPDIPEPGLASALTYIDLHNNSFTGNLPATWGSLPLRILNLSQNPRLAGSVPPLWRQLAPEFVNLASTGICGSKDDLRAAWGTATTIFNADMAPCSTATSSSSTTPSSSTRAPEPSNNADSRAKYTVLLSMYVVASIFIVTAVLFIVGHSCLCRNRPLLGARAAAGAAPAPSAGAPEPPPGPPPTLIIMPGSQVCVGYPVSLEAAKDEKGKGAEQGVGDVEMGGVRKPRGRGRAGSAGGGDAPAPAATGAAVATAAACLRCTGGGCVRHDRDQAS